MLAAALALIVAGVIMAFIFAPLGIAAGVVGLLLLVAHLAGFGRRAKEGEA
jgi:hypothetical protein